MYTLAALPASIQLVLVRNNVLSEHTHAVLEGNCTEHDVRCNTVQHKES